MEENELNGVTTNETTEGNELYFKDCFSQSEGRTNLEVNNLKANCITSPSNAFSLDNEGNLVVKSVQTTGTDQSAIDFPSIFNKVYPIGSIYMSINNTNPGTLFGGVWEQIKDTFLLASGDSYASGTTGGSASVTLTIDNLPSHNHSFTGTSHAHNLNGHTHSIPSLSVSIDSSGEHTHTGRWRNGYSRNGNNYLVRRVSDEDGYDGTDLITNPAGAHTHTGSTGTGTTGANWGTTEWITAGGTIGSTGSGMAHNNMPPYLAVCVWKRVS